MDADRAKRRSRRAKRKHERELARLRKDRFNARVRDGLGISDGVPYDGPVLGLLVVCTNLTNAEATAGDKAKITEAIAKYLRDQSRGPKNVVTPFRCSHCGRLIVDA